MASGPWECSLERRGSPTTGLSIGVTGKEDVEARRSYTLERGRATPPCVVQAAGVGVQKLSRKEQAGRQTEGAPPSWALPFTTGAGELQGSHGRSEAGYSQCPAAVA